MKKLNFVWLIALFLVASLAGPSWAASVSVVDKETVKGWMDNGGVTVLDARTGRDWKSSEFKVKGAHRADPGKLAAWKSKFAKDEKIVLYCA
jgi:rhodanese-related sulfurtransferase